MTIDPPESVPPKNAEAVALFRRLLITLTHEKLIAKLKALRSRLDGGETQR
ncbi:MAG: hypothetical protein AB8G77_06070 [Rhodothermales bacterium]